MPFEFIVALRYLRAKRKQAAVSVITGISVVGVAAGVGALIVALAMNTGFTADLQTKLLGAQPHITLLTQNGEGILNYRDIIARVEQVEGVVAAAPALHQYVLLSNGFKNAPVLMKGIVPEFEARRSTVLESLVEGRMEDFGEHSLLMGEELANSIGSFLGDVVQAQSIETVVTPAGRVPRRHEFDLGGIFRTGLYEYDAQYVLAPLWKVQRLSGYDPDTSDQVSSIEIQIADPNLSEVLGQRIIDEAAPALAFTDWKTQNRGVFQALQLERLAMWLAIGLIVLVASLNIVGTLVMMVVEKTRDIAVLMSMGATRRNIRRVFIAQGVIIGTIGTASGVFLGNLIAIVCDRYQLIRLAEEVWSIDHVPFDPSWTDSAVVAAAAILVSYLATLYPSRSASSLEPVESLRYE
jgi:lipoprotein-releasing system permease protein